MTQDLEHNLVRWQANNEQTLEQREDIGVETSHSRALISILQAKTYVYKLILEISG